MKTHKLITLRSRINAHNIGMALGSIITLILVAIVMVGCQSDSDSAYNSMPTKVQKFVTRYFPGYSVDQCTVTPDAVHVKLKNGPGITFDSQRNLEAVNGYGETLPQVLLFDTLPPAMFQYLQEGDNLDQVFTLSFSPTQVVAELLSTTVIYDTRTTRITQTPTEPD